MTIIKWSPAREIASLQQGINRLFEDVFSQGGDQDSETMGAWRPSVDIIDTEAAIIIYAEIPGVAKEAVAIEVKENVLSISGERTVDNALGNGSYMRSERVFGKFARSFALPAMIPTEKISASFKEGVLKITIPKPEQEQPRKVSINVE
ncbi:MAG: Hsp20/alpha crystallin family protein [Desulfobacterales bacterium]|nr:Hsp20/alpha crystallin family protein [Desulfobacterales bacterium]MDJ0855713.1 Hsp20/alpha crystallin family protein [Desulfobacterales bacterium]MDJ0887454.1 Hsp20/alpha crystallin family protein [Desulfobacterales bacterium]MDJ0990687.1 Hsp20/alpha crystallin family protein [Desulfobacterales bacterium]